MYQPFPIYDFRSGLQLDREPWLLPQSAFQIANNVYHYNGRLWKRRGYEGFGVGTGGSGVNVLASPPVMGLWNFFTKSGGASFFAFDTEFMYKYNDTNDDWEGVGGYPTTPDWTGDDSDFFWTEIWQDLFFITNNKDIIKYWNGSVLTNLQPNCGPGGTLDSCLMLINHKDRLIALNTQESVDGRQPQRARCSNVGSYSQWDDDIYVDANTVDWIVGAAFVRGELMVFFERSIWWLRYTGDPGTPFAWESIAETDGCYATYSVVNFEDEAIGLGPTSWVGSDGLETYSISEKIPDIVLDLNPLKVNYAYGIVADELMQYLCSFASQGQDYPDKCLVLNYKDNAFSIYDLPFHVAGYYVVGGDKTMDGISTTWDQTAFSWDERVLSAGYPITIIGDRSGYTWQLFTADADDGDPIEGLIRTRKLVPFQTHKSKLGYLDIIGSSGSQINIDVKLYKDDKASPYLTRTVNFYNQGRDRARVRIRVMETGDHHTIEITDNAANNPWTIDAIVPHFKQAGPLR